MFDLTASGNCRVSSAWLVFFFNELHVLVYAPTCVFTERRTLQQGADRHPNGDCVISPLRGCRWFEVGLLTSSHFFWQLAGPNTHTKSSLYLVSLQHAVYSVSRRSPAAPLRWFDYKPLQQKREANPDHFHLHGFRESLFCLSEFETAWLNFDSISWPDTAMLLSVLGTKHNKHTSGYKSP